MKRVTTSFSDSAFGISPSFKFAYRLSLPPTCQSRVERHGRQQQRGEGQGFVAGQPSLSRPELMGLVHLGGGRVVRPPPDLDLILAVLLHRLLLVQSLRPTGIPLTHDSQLTLDAEKRAHRAGA
eukprot:1721529-Rhodomonas_salina.1